MPAAVNQVNLVGHLPASPAIRREGAFVDFNLITGTVTHRIRIADAARAGFLAADMPEGTQVIVAGAELAYDAGSAIVLVGPSASIQVAFEGAPVHQGAPVQQTAPASAPVVTMPSHRTGLGVRPVGGASSPPPQVQASSQSAAARGHFSQMREAQSSQPEAPVHDRPADGERPAARLPQRSAGASPSSQPRPNPTPPQRRSSTSTIPDRMRAGVNEGDKEIPL